MKNRDVESEAAGRKSNIETDKQNISFLYLSEEDMIDAGVLNPGRCAVSYTHLTLPTILRV